MAKENSIEGKIILRADTSVASGQIKKFVDDIASSTARLNSGEGIHLRDNLAQLRLKLADLRTEMRKTTDYDGRLAIQKQIETVSKEVTQANRELTNFIRTGDKAQSVLGKNFEAVANSAGGMGTKILESLGVFEVLKRSFDFVVGTIKNMGQQIITLAGNLEQAQISFSTMLGSGERARDLLRDLSKFAQTTPFNIPQVRENAKMLLAVGVSADNVIGIMKSLGDVASGLDIPMSRLTLNLGQIITQGKLTGRELRDFLIAGVPLVDELAKNLGVAKSEISDLVRTGDISADQVIEAFRTMTSEGGRFEDLMQRQSESFQGRISNIKDGLTVIAEQIGTKLLPMLKKIEIFIQGQIAPDPTNNIVQH